MSINEHKKSITVKEYVKYRKAKTNIKYFIAKKRCSVSKLAKELYASEATIRRDLNVLASEGKIEKVFGGAIICENYAEEVPFSVRKDERIIRVA